jgi:translation initiation factor IF-2
MSPASATRRASRGGSPTGRGSNKGPAAASPKRPEPPERPAEGTVAPPDRGPAGSDPVPHPARRAPPEGHGRRDAGAVATPGPSGAVLSHPGRRLLRPWVRDRVPRGEVAGGGRPVGGGRGRGHQAPGRAERRAGGPVRRPAGPGAVAAVRAQAQPCGAVGELAQLGAVEPFRPARGARTRRGVVAELASKRDDQAFLRNLFQASELPLPRTLFFRLSITLGCTTG